MQYKRKKNILVIIGLFFLCSCLEKPPMPKERKTEPISRQISNNNYKHLPLPNHRSQKTTTTKAQQNAVLSPSEIFDKYSTAVFKIHTSIGNQGFQGSGFFVSENGIAISNYHVFEGTTIGNEEIILSDEKKYKITKIYHKSKENDFIIFKVGINQKVNFINIASSTVKVGEKIYTISSPLGLQNTFSSGEISQIREGGNILQISAPIDHGSSGGVLLNSYGQAIGITTSGYTKSGANLNFAVNIKLVKPYIP